MPLRPRLPPRVSGWARVLVASIVVAQLSGLARADDKAKPKKTPASTPALLLPKPDDSQAPARLDPLLLQRSYDRAKAKRNAGVSLAAPGVALSLLGGVAVIFGTFDPNLLSKATEIIFGGAVGLVGLAVGIPGIYLWSTGQDDMDVATWRMRQFTP